jgi:4-amino-4-deoxy-L-arabinose transferase-like glycosyltransferase
MVAWWKRILLSLLSVVVAAVVCLLSVVLWSAVKSHPVSFRSSEVLLTIAVTVVFCVIAWLFSVPVVLIVRNIRGWRFWFYWIVGSCVGPALMLVLCAVIIMQVSHGRTVTWYNPEELPLLFMSAAISSVSALIYLSLLRRAQAAAIKKGH